MIGGSSESQFTGWIGARIGCCLMESLREWLDGHAGLLWTLGAVSLVIFVASLFAIPAVIARIPADYFAHAERPASPWAGRRPAVRAVMVGAKNALGVVLLAAGVAMLVLPGQGLLTLLVGFFMLDFPRKYRFEQWLLARRWVHRPINWLRGRRGRDPLRLPGGGAGAA